MIPRFANKTQVHLALREYLVKIQKTCELGNCKIRKIHTDCSTEYKTFKMRKCGTEYKTFKMRKHTGWAIKYSTILEDSFLIAVTSL